MTPALASGDNILDVRGLGARYGRIEALHDVDLHVRAGEFVAVLGPNGAGKSTLLRAIMGLTDRSGSVEFHRRALPPRGTSRIAGHGIVLVPEGRGIFAPMTVAENLQLGAYGIGGRGAVFDARLQRVLTLFPRLKERMKQSAGTMSGGEQQMLAVGRALMADPKLLLLDEPSLGLAPRVTGEILDTLGRLNAEGLPIILVEQKAPLALKLATRAYVVANGRISAHVKTRDVKSHADLAQFYFQ